MRRTGVFAALFLLGSTALTAGKLELVSRVPPRAASDTAAGFSHTGLGFLQTGTISADGRYLVFVSAATNLVPGQVPLAGRDPGWVTQVYVHDQVTGATSLVSRSERSPVTPANSSSDSPRISADGRFIVFSSDATDLVPGFIPELKPVQVSNLYLHDRVTGSTVLVSHARTSTRASADGLSDSAVLSADGRYVAFRSFARNLLEGRLDPGTEPDIFLYDRRSGRTVRVSHSARSFNRRGLLGEAHSPSISADGRFVAFSSTQPDLLIGQVNTHSPEVFVYDRETHTNSLVSRASSPVRGEGGTSPVISADGRSIAYLSASTRLVPGQTGAAHNLFLFHRPSGVTRLVSHTAASLTEGAGNVSAEAALSADGAWVAFVRSELPPPDEENVFLYERATGAIRLVSHSFANPSAGGDGRSLLSGLSADGSRVLFQSNATNLTPEPPTEGPNIFLYERSSGENSLVSRDPGASPFPRSLTGPGSVAGVISADGDTVAFTSNLSNLVPGVRDLNEAGDVFLFHRRTGELELVTRRDPARPSRTSQGESFAGDLSEDGRYAVFASRATELIPGMQDANQNYDIFLYDRVTKGLTLVSHAAGSPLRTGDGPSFFPRISDDGRFVLYHSIATDLVPGQVDRPGDNDFSTNSDAFLYDRTTGTNILVSRKPGTEAEATGQVLSSVLSGDGSTVAYNHTAESDILQVYLFDRATGARTLASHAPGAPGVLADGAAYGPSISADGRFTAFISPASNLSPDVRPHSASVFLPQMYIYDRNTDSVIWASRPAFPAEEPASSDYGLISADGRYLAHTSASPNLAPGQIDNNFSTDVFLFDRAAGISRLLSHLPGRPNHASGQVWNGLVSLSADAGAVAFMGAGEIASGQTGDPAEPDVLVWERATDQVRLVSRAPDGGAANGDSIRPVVSLDGRWVAFSSTATNLAPGPYPAPRQWQAYLFDRTTGGIVLVSRSNLPPFPAGNFESGGTQGGGLVTVSSTGHVLFDSFATNLVAGDLNFGATRMDVFLYVP